MKPGVWVGIGITAALLIAAASMGPPALMQLVLSSDAGGTAANPIYATITNPSASASMGIDLRSDGGGSAGNPFYVAGMSSSTHGSIDLPSDGGGTAGNPLRTMGIALCINDLQKMGTPIVSNPDAGQNCFVAAPGIQKWFQSTARACVKVGSIPTSCTDYVTSNGIRIPKDTPIDMPFSGTPTVYGDGGLPVDGGRAPTHLLICGLPNSTSDSLGGVLEYVPYTDCGATP